MAQLSIQSIISGGDNPIFIAASVGGDKFAWAEGRYIHVKNNTGSPLVITFNSTILCSQGFDHDIVITIPDTQERLVGKFEPRFVDPAGNVNIDYSPTVVGVTVGAFDSIAC